ncbi:hypothetical protein FHW20_001140 [Ochrobactrum intermedium]|uniref:STAS domain-containing protein n=1 Tax=Brucella intermedia TaxID=94625 RepID=A0ABR6ALU6_9HYPH|nr:hypothetical protein [Brucella intermedia]
MYLVDFSNLTFETASMSAGIRRQNQSIRRYYLPALQQIETVFIGIVDVSELLATSTAARNQTSGQ